jgi:predicted NACHT family NTPase
VEEEITVSDFREPEIETGKGALDRRRERERIVRKTTRRVALEDALRAHTRLMVLGDPGAGKSTLLRYLALTAALQADEGRRTNDQSPSSSVVRPSSSVIRLERRLPILLPLRRFAASSEALVDFLYTYAKQTYQLELPHGFFERALEAGRCLVLFDGLDEVTASDQRVEVRDAVAALATRYSKNRFVVTSRIIGYESAPLDRNTFAHHTIMPFNESEIATFIEKWYTARERDAHQANAQAEQLIRTIQQNDRLKKLAENPLMLTIIALVHRIETDLPNERVKLYDKCTEALLTTWEGVKGIPYDRERPHYKQRRRLLERLAFWMHTLEQAEGRQAEVKRGDLELKLTDLLL